ncbi:MAG: fused MFS/spermidine synthase [Burkholderiales bacterium]|jgi:SAM-dependent methyltransferase|nr:fused MFS/spermidine synthase [Burkholderiales bacterium]
MRAHRPYAPPFVLFAATILASAFLLFEVQPLIARVILPWFGGSAAVWTACMVFFQVTLLVGYAYAHVLVSRVRPRLQGVVHLALLAASLAALPILPSESWKPAVEGDPTGRILLLLFAVVGLPYFLLSTTGPLVQAWFARAHPEREPYRLYALSNFGSMVALLSYPLVIEPFMATRLQAYAWSAGYLVFALLVGTLAAGLLKLADPAPRVAALPGATKPRAAEKFAWFALAAVPSVLLLAITHHLTQNISPIPFLWVVPLALYLLSFILSFESDRWYRRWLFLPAALALAAGMAWTLSDTNKNTSIWLLIPLHCAGLFVAAMTCHGELARLRPQPRYLTAYYLMISLGGAAGGVFVGLLAPNMFPDYYELPLGLAALLAVAVWAVWRATRAALPRPKALGATAFAGVAAAAVVAMLVWQKAEVVADSVMMGRNFYGTVRVQESGAGESAQRMLLHGTINHGKQFIAPGRLSWPTTYYGPDSGVALAIAATRTDAPQRVGIVGLGTGTLTAYSRSGDAYRVYEINPLVDRVAREQFRYLANASGKVETVIGDARLSMEREPDQQYDVLAIDAFSSDAIPVHLLTREAFATYLRHVRPGGVLALHISNRYLDLAPVLQQLAGHFGKYALKIEADGDDAAGTYNTTWVLIADSPGALEAVGLASAGTPLDAEAAVRLWTDDYSNLLKLARFKSKS